MNSPFRASVPVCKTGYTWLRPKKKHENRLLVCEPVARGVAEITPEYFRHYDPFKTEPALFRVFADVQPTEEAIVAFANQYGDPSPDVWGWPFEKWTFEIGSMRAAIELADAVMAHDHQMLAKHVGWKGHTVAWTSILCQELGTPSGSEERLPSFREGSLVAPATYLLDWVLERYTSFELSFVTSRLPGDALVLSFETNSLSDVVWLQLALAVSKEKEYRRCELCGRPFELSPETNRSDRLFCSDACRMRAFRRRKARAAEMRAVGKTLRQIAKEVGSDLSTIKKWLQHREDNK